MNIKIESGLQLIARLTPRPTIEKLDNVLFCNGLKSNDIVEISGSSPCAKVLLLTHLIKNAALIDKYKNYSTHGLNTGVILIDLDHHFCIRKLADFIRNSITETMSNDEKDAIVSMSLENLTVIKCYNSIHLRSSLCELKTYLIKNPNISLIVLNNVAANYWQDLMIGGIRKMDLYKIKIIREIEKNIQDFKMTLIYTKPDFFESKTTIAESSMNFCVNYKINLLPCKDKTDSNNYTIEVVNGNKSYSCKVKISVNGIEWVQ